MRNKKLLGYLTGLVCIALCVALALTACRIEKDDPEDQNPTVGEQTTAPTEGRPSTDEPTQPEQTEPEATQPEATEPEKTEPEETEPEATQPSGGSTGPSVNTGTGGGYDPGASQPTEPGDATEPEIVVPEPGSEKNAYAEYVADSGSFSTVKIPAGKEIYYRLKTAGSFLRVEDGNVTVIMGETVYEASEGVLEIALPADDTQAMTLVFVNNKSEDKAFAVEIRGTEGSESNPIILNSIADIQTALEEGNADGVYYSWVADQSGVLKMALGNVECADGVADAVITVNGKTVRLSEGNGQAEIPVNAGNEVIIQVLTGENADGIHPAAQIQVSGYVALIVDLEVSEIPSRIESVTVAAQQSVIYRITGAGSMSLKITDSDFAIVYEGTVCSPDAEGVILVDLPVEKNPAELELINQSDAAKATQLSFDYPLGHKLNPYNLKELGQLAVQIPENQAGYYYTYTVPSTGLVQFHIWTHPEQESVKTDIVITNETTGTTAALWPEDADGEPAQNATVSMPANADDVLTIWVSVTDIFGYDVYTSLEITGELYGTQEHPILVEYPGFTATVPAGGTLYYECYNMSGLIFALSGSDVTVAHNGDTYTPADGKITFTVVAEGRNPAQFAVTNTGSQTASYEATFAYPVGHVENPAALVLGTNTVTRNTGDSDYYFTFTAPRAGTLTLTFDSNAQWAYTMDNLTQGVYGDTQWSDSDPLMSEMTLTVKAKDQIQIRVNTYDAANMFENPAGTVTFDAKYITGPKTISNTTVVTNAGLIPGEGGLFTGKFSGLMLKISNAKNAAVEFDGVRYTPNAAGNITVKFPDSGTETLQFILYNTGASQSSFAMQFSSGEVGTAANPEELSAGSFSMVQDKTGGPAYYYEYVATKTVTLIITFETDTDAMYLINNSVLRYTNMGQNTYRMTVREGSVFSLLVNTYDPANPRVSPEGTVDFTVEIR